MIKKLILDLLPEDIKGAVPGDGRHCPIARAVTRRLRLWPGECCVTSEWVLACNRYKAPVNRRMMAFIQRFDCGKPVAPTRFIIRFVDKEE